MLSVIFKYNLGLLLVVFRLLHLKKLLRQNVRQGAVPGIEDELGMSQH